MDGLSQQVFRKAGRLCVAFKFVLFSTLLNSLLSFSVTTTGQAEDYSSQASRQIDLSHARQVRGARQVTRPATSSSNDQLTIPRPPAIAKGERQPSITSQAKRRSAQTARPSSASKASPQRKPLFQTMGQARSKTARPSAIKQAAYGESLSEPIPEGLVPASYYGHSATCDGCASCGVEPICGVEPMCGCEGPVCGCEPVCGAEILGGACNGTCGGGCGVAVEASCGFDGYVCDQPGCDSCGGAYVGATCGVEPSCGFDGRHVECVPLLLPILPINWCRFEFFAGVQGFTGPANFAAGDLLGDRSGTGSFGFHQGFNYGRPLRDWLGIDWAAQFGLRATQNNIEASPFSNDSRNQVFITTGLSRRVDYGLQMGVVYDYLNDDWFYHAELGQVRGELSWKTGGCHEFGYRFMGGVNDSTSVTRLIDAAGVGQVGSLTFQATDQHRFFYRRDLGGDGWIDGFVGTTDTEDTLLGMDIATPLRGRWGLRGGFAYLNPGDPNGGIGNHEEGWNVSMSIIWRPCGRTGKCDSYYKPLFDVADNGTFMVDTL